MAETKKPNIRFKGFTDDWEQCKLSDLVSYESSNLTAKDVKELGMFDLYDANGIIGKADCLPIKTEYISIIKDGAGVGRIRKMPANTLIIGTMGALVTNNSNLDFIYSLLTRFNPGEEYTGSTIPHIYFKDYGNNEYYIPKNEEKIAIGDYFANLDHLITLHQRKYDKLQNVKKSMLEKMFPKNGSNVPEIRFAGFTDPWEQRKLNEFLTVSNEKNIDDIFGKEDVLSVSGDYGIVNQIEFQGRSFAGASVSNYGVVHTGDIVYTKSPLSSNPYGIIKTNKGKAGIVSTLYAVYHPKENTFADFVQTYFEQHARMNNYMHPLVNKGAKNDMKVSAENALKGYVIFPSYIEQELISKYFASLDHLITLHQRELEKLKNIKKSMLEKMFV